MPSVLQLRRKEKKELTAESGIEDSRELGSTVEEWRFSAT